MFFIFGISNGEKKLEFVQAGMCPGCGQFGRLELYITYMYFSLFFIPIFRWNKKFYVKSSCCRSVYGIDKELGSRIEKGEQITLREQDLQIFQESSYHYNIKQKKCFNCGYMAEADFDFCPKCGNRMY
ncbi:zinc ribbon domain-containing protein [Mobilitalea sibirica]|uniref:Zinc ribbon domain-containing protein n=1 Tax=Mobilitalea sibirica TaxID=1462919 RepID=A0A8J7KXM5_9FIRM|nr:zinc ribbon domain-containing protein [Mobilitalea sibirica]MBH1941967.1 zinc ribbon domain-containing protein [Mobilitalea sibirica]